MRERRDADPNADTGQVALAAVAGYRGRFVAGTLPPERDGLLATSFDYLRGFA
jgi:hypothetical protein